MWMWMSGCTCDVASLSARRSTRGGKIFIKDVYPEFYFSDAHAELPLWRLLHPALLWWSSSLDSWRSREERKERKRTGKEIVIFWWLGQNKTTIFKTSPLRACDGDRTVMENLEKPWNLKMAWKSPWKKNTSQKFWKSDVNVVIFICSFTQFD